MERIIKWARDLDKKEKIYLGIIFVVFVLTTTYTQTIGFSHEESLMWATLLSVVAFVFMIE